MGTAARGKFPALIQDLLDRGPDYDFYQAVSLVETCCEGPLAQAGGLAGALKLRPAPEISFPAADIRRCSFDEQGRLDFELNFLGLYGVDGPLPHFFLETVAGQDDLGKVLRAFLDVFNQRLYQLLYLGWKKSNDHGRQNQCSLYERYLGAVAGLTPAQTQGQSLAYAGLMGSRIKNAAGLVGLLKDFLQMPVSVRQHFPCWVTLSHRPALGAAGEEGLVLGENCSLGDRVLDVSRKILIRIGEVPISQAVALLPGREQALELGRLIRQYLNPTIEFDIELLVTSEPGPPIRLGCQEAILGWSAGLGEMGEKTYRIQLPGSSFNPDRASRPTNH
ncbi:MAG: type VI secretion system baseplate subunit TssG [Trichloromonadaceae bacterium]